MMGRASTYEAYKLLDAGRFDGALFCTYTFDSSFFEEYCLKRFSSLENNNNITVLLDQRSYNDLAVLPQEQRPRYANVRYLLHPVKVSGRFHPKLILLTGRDRGRLIVGSANLSRAGLTSNAEIVGCYDYITGRQEEFVPLFRAAFNYVCLLSARWPSQNLSSSIQDMARTAPWLMSVSESSDGPELLDNLEQPLFQQLVARFDEPLTRVSVVSPFFDQSSALLTKLAEISGAATLGFFTQNVHTTLSPQWLDDPLSRSAKARFFVETFITRGRHQKLHAKLFVLESKRQCVIAAFSISSM